MNLQIYTDQGIPDINPLTSLLPSALHDQGFKCSTHQAGRGIRDVIKWTAPEAGMTKLNTDGSFLNMCNTGHCNPARLRS